jgi:ABC-type multidrug transport system fused ATPase/permease subunit
MFPGGGHGAMRPGRRSGGESLRAGADGPKGTTAPKGGFFTLLIEIWPFIRPHRALLLAGFFLMIINRLAGLVLPASMKFLVDDVLGKRQTQLLVPISLAVLGAALVQGATSFTLTQQLSKAAQRMITTLRKQVQAHVGRLPIAYHDATKTGSLVTRVMNDVEGLRNLIGTGLVEFAGSIMTSIFALIVLLRISPYMTGVAVAVLVGCAIALSRAIRFIRPIFRARSKLNAEVTGRLTESFAGVRVVKGYHAEDREEAAFAAGAQRLLDNVLKTLTATSIMSLSATMLLGVVSALIMYMGATRILNGTMTMGTFITFVAFLAMMVAPIFQIVNVGTQLTEAMAGLERTSELLAEKPEDADPRRSIAIGTINGEVQFENVNFSYTQGQEVLHEVSFSAQPGSVTALIGSSGAGKSTITGLIAAFYVPTSGTVRVDGIDLSTIRLDSYRSQLGVVLQDTFLFDGTIRENVAFSRPDAGEERILAACRIARVNEFAESFPEKYDTVVGERGVKLSGGQKQRISIARAILADPRILILDEATSSLDSESEAWIQAGLTHLMRGRTTFVIAHRLSTIRRSDQILVLESGRVVERGTHETLYARAGRYFELYTKQYGLETNLFLAPGEGDAVEPSENGGAAPNGEGRRAAGDTGLASAARLLRGREP